MTGAGFLYCDGANLNALMGKARFGDMGVDVCHLNLTQKFFHASWRWRAGRRAGLCDSGARAFSADSGGGAKPMSITLLILSAR